MCVCVIEHAMTLNLRVALNVVNIYDVTVDVITQSVVLPSLLFRAVDLVTNVSVQPLVQEDSPTVQ